jgi:hypothetical protein
LPAPAGKTRLFWEKHMADAIFIGLSIAFFAASLGLIHVFEKLREERK